VTNLRSAAFHLQYLLRVRLKSPLQSNHSKSLQGETDFPAKIEDLEAKLREIEVLEYSTTDVQTLDEMEKRWSMGKPKMPSLRFPLFAALTMTPLILLQPRQLDSKPIGLEKLFEVRSIFP
jgi:hypothetical protein